LLQIRCIKQHKQQGNIAALSHRPEQVRAVFMLYKQRKQQEQVEQAAPPRPCRCAGEERRGLPVPAGAC
jgi:hypothetical protein